MLINHKFFKIMIIAYDLIIIKQKINLFYFLKKHVNLIYYNIFFNKTKYFVKLYKKELKLRNYLFFIFSLIIKYFLVYYYLKH